MPSTCRHQILPPRSTVEYSKKQKQKILETVPIQTGGQEGVANDKDTK